MSRLAITPRTLIQRQDALVAQLEPVYRKRRAHGYLGAHLAAQRSRAKRLHCEEMRAAGYTQREAMESAQQADDVACLNVDHEDLLAVLGAAS